MRVLFTAAEMSPFSKVGGLADVAASLPKALARLGLEIRVITPFHTSSIKGTELPIGREVTWRVSTMGFDETVILRELEVDGALVYLVENERFFARPRVYGEPDDLARYLFLSQVALEAPKALGWWPDIFHCHDWHTAFIPFGLKNRAWGDPNYAPCASLLTIHNLRYRGPDDLLDILGQGIYYADGVNTVSETYAQEILTPEYGEGLHPLLRSKGARFSGILNGIDYNEFNPATDPNLAQNYHASTVELRRENKRLLQERAGLPMDSDIPLVGMVSRLAAQKGLDLLDQVLQEALDKLSFQFVLVGVGDESYHRLLEEVMGRYPNQVKAFFTFDSSLAQLVYGGCDIFLMPSQFEPCGLGQLIAMRYGAVPLVRRTGGLADTVQDCGPEMASGNGFVFGDYTPQALMETLERAVGAFQNKGAWKNLMARAMAKDHSWDASAKKYIELYQKIRESHSLG